MPKANPKLIILYGLYNLSEMPLMDKFKRLHCWKTTQKVLAKELLEVIQDLATQPHEIERLIVELNMFLINSLRFSKLDIHSLNTFTNENEIKAMNKRHVRLISVDCCVTLQIFLAIVVVLLYEVKMDEDFLKVEIYSRVEERDIEKVRHLHQIYHIRLLSHGKDMPSGNIIEEKDLLKAFEV